MTEDHSTVEMTADVVSAFVSNNSIPAGELPNLIRDVHAAMSGIATGEPEVAPQEPAVPVKRSIGRDTITCLEDGKKFKSLKRHLRTHHDLSPEEYREKWSLPADYPMVAPSYAEERSALAKKSGLGQKRKKK